MRKQLREGVDYGKVSEKVVAIIKGKGHTVVLFTDDGMETSNPEEARRFYVKDPNYMITVDQDSATIRINKNSSVDLSEIEAVMKQIKNLARNYMLKSELKVFGKEIAPKDFAYQAKKLRDEKMNGINEASFSRMHGHKKTSYQTLESTKLIVRHKKEVDEDVRGSRARQIKAIFIERAGERFKFPHNCLPCARAMARHIDEGGEMHDNVGQYIIEVSGNLKQLVEFANYARNNKLINEDSEDIVKIVRENIAAYKRELQKFQGTTTYAKMCEQIANREGSELEEETNDLKDMFTVKKFDERIGETLPLIKRLVTEKNAWRSMIEEASVEPFQVTSTENLIENDAIEFDSPVQKLGYKIRTLSERVTEESDLSKFVHKIGNKMIEGVELSKFEKSVMRNVLENISVAEEVVADEDGFTDKLEEVMNDFERKMKVMEFDMDWDRGYNYEGPQRDDWEPATNMCPDCEGAGGDCERCDGVGEVFEGGITEDPNDWSDEEAEEDLYKGFYGDDEGFSGEELPQGYGIEQPDCEECGGSGLALDDESDCYYCDGTGKTDKMPDDNLEYDPEEQWMDPAGGLHYHDEDDPASMYEETPADNDPYSGSDIPELDDPSENDYYPAERGQPGWHDCESCDGTGTSSFSDDYCWDCGGEGGFFEGISEARLRQLAGLPKK